MSPELAQSLPLILIALAALLLVILIVMRLRKKTRVLDKSEGDVLDEGAEKPRRNQALIDAPKAVSQDIGVTSANANSDKVAAAGARADAEAGAKVAPNAGQPAPEPAPSPASPTAPAPALAATAPSAPTGADDLRRIKGIGPKLVTILAEQGITRFDQIAAWTEEDIARVDATLGRFAGRIERDQWVEQAKLLAAGDESGFVQKFGRT